MSGFQSPITIDQAMQYIKRNEYLLPAFQREYVWYPEDIEALFDSIMRDYPINSMLLWRVRDESKASWQFYQFLDYYREEYHTHNILFNTKGHKDFFAILDGQQRLTSIYLALFSHYDIHRSNHKWENDDRRFKISHLYFNLTQSLKPKNPDIQFEFLWLDKEVTQEQTIYVDRHSQKWFKCSDLYLYETTVVRKICRKYSLEETEEERLELFYQKIFNKQLINYYLEEDQDPDKAVNIFIRINAGGESLDYSDILFSIAVANWKRDARTEINNLVDMINENFRIDKDLILKGFLYLYHSNIKFQINSFSKEFISLIESKWERIKACFIETFKLLYSFGFSAQTLSSNNISLPILYYIYHNDLEDHIVSSTSQAKNREIIKKWILRSIVFKPFSSSSDTVLANMRRAFVEQFDGETFINHHTPDLFPSEDLEKESKGYHVLDEEFLDSILLYRKAKPEAFAILALLFPNLDYKNWNFHRDHLHPEASYKEYEKLCKKNGYEVYSFSKYDSLPNLQMLDANKNMSKQNKSLEEWIVEEKAECDTILQDCLIPDCDLSLESFNEFFELRKEMMKDKLKKILEK